MQDFFHQQYVSGKMLKLLWCERIPPSCPHLKWYNLIHIDHKEQHKELENDAKDAEKFLLGVKSLLFVTWLEHQWIVEGVILQLPQNSPTITGEKLFYKSDCFNCLGGGDSKNHHLLYLLNCLVFTTSFFGEIFGVPFKVIPPIHGC